MSTQGQGDVVERLRAAAREIRNDGTASQVGLSEQECEDIADEITRLRALLSSSRGEQAVRERLTSALKDFLVYYHGTDEQQAELQADFSGPDGMLPDAEVRSLVFRNAQKALAESWELDGTIPSAPGSVPTSIAGQVPDDLLSAVDTFIRCTENGYFGKRGLKTSPIFLAMKTARERSPAGARGNHPELLSNRGPAPLSSPQPTARGDAPEQKLGRFDHHPDPAIDFCCEVEAIIALDYDAAHSLAGATVDDVLKRIDRAMSFRVGGDEHCVRAKQTLREIEKRIRPPVADALSAERARVIEECARVAGEKSAMLPHQNDFVRGYANGRADAAAALRSLAQQDTGGADHG
jgi:hypothetical protein